MRRYRAVATMTHILTVHANAQPIGEARRCRQAVADAGSHRTVIIRLSSNLWPIWTAIFAAHQCFDGVLRGLVLLTKDQLDER
jgi:hypothetical protein